MRSQVVVTLFAALVLLSTAPESAEAGRNRSSGRSFNASSEFGLGLILGGPTGLTGKYYLGGDTAIDFAIGDYYRGRYDDTVQMHADFLWHPVVLADPAAFQLPLYIGIGARYLEHDYFGDARGSHIGLRVPFGILFYLNNTPLDFFIEMAYVLDIVRDDGHGRFNDFDLALGFRYYF